MKQRVFNTLFPQEFTEQSLFTSEAIAKINKAINSLPVNYREAFILNRFQGMTYNDIAKKLNVSPKTIDYRIQNALKILRVELKDFLPLFLLFFSEMKVN